MSIDAAISIAWDVLKCVVIPIKRQFGYMMSSKRYAQDLQKEVGKLAYEIQRVHNAIEEARNNLRNVYDQVTKWQESAEKALEEAQVLLGHFERASKTCCYGTLPDPNCRYQFSKKAKDKIEGIRLLARECSEFKDISFSSPAPGNVAAPSPPREEGKDVIKLRDDGIFESRASMISNIMDALADNRYSVVGVHGMGGVGKSTLLADAEKRIREEKSFDWVAKADVSEHQDIKRIQEEIAQALGLRDIKNEEYVSVRAELLRRRLENEVSSKKKVLIILDNLWEVLDLNKVGIPCGYDNKVIGCKLLLTSRDQNVLRREMGCDRDFLLGGLREEEAKGLFGRMVGDKVHDDEFKSLVDEALHRCAGLPFLIVAMAKLFKDAHLSEWKDVLKQIEMSKNEGIGKVINNMLQLSYDHLKVEEAKSLLQLCVIYGVSEPSLESLVRYGMGLGLFGENSSMEEARNRLSALIRTLQASSLLLENGDSDGFKVHDLVREFIVSVASRDQPLLILKEKDKFETKLPKDKLKNCKAICFPYVDMEELPEELDCPELQIFLLFMNKYLNVPDSLFNSMRKLMVLNLTGIHLTRSPLPFQLSENLHTLCLDGCMLDNVAILGKLKGLQILSFANSNIKQLPKEIGQLIELRLLDLNVSQLQIIEPGVLGSLVKLEELYMIDSFVQWNAVEQTPPTNASLIELNHMKNLRTLDVHIRDPSILPKDLNFEKFTRYKIQIGNVWRGSNEYKGSRTLDLNLNPTDDIFQKGYIRTALDTIDELFLDGSDGIKQSICELSLEGFPKLKHLYVQNSPSVDYILRQLSLSAFKMLESLFLENLINFEKICHNHISSMSFRALKVVRVKRCPKMEVLFPLSLSRELPQLGEIEVVDCNFMREIVEVDDPGKVELRNLHKLELCGLPNIKNFFTAGMTPSSSALDCEVGTQVAFFNGQQVAFPNLETLNITSLDKLEFMFSPSMVKSLAKLKNLTVSYCEKMEVIITKEDELGVESLETLTFPILTDLYLVRLESLTCFSHEKCSREAQSRDNVRSCSTVLFNREVVFPNLKTLSIGGLDKLEFMLYPYMVKSLSQLKKLTVFNCKKMEAIITEEEGWGMEASETLTFSMLTDLYLEGLESLTCFSRAKCSREARSQDIVKSSSTELINREVAFPNLKTLSIIGLDKLEFMLYPYMVKSLSQLKELSIWNCKKMEAIITEEEGWGMEASETLTFPMLTYLHLGRLESLTCFSRGKCSQEAWSQDSIKSSSTEFFNREVLIPSLESLWMSGLPNLKYLWSDEFAWELSNFRSLEISSCESLSKVINSQLWVKLHKLHTLTIEVCNSVEEIFYLDVPNTSGNVETFSQLTTLKLNYLGSLRHIWNKNPCEIVRFHNLQRLEVSQCDNLQFIFFPSMVKSLAKLSALEVYNCDKMEAIIMEEEGLGMETLETLAFPLLTNLELSGLESLTCFSHRKSSRKVRRQEHVKSCFNVLFDREVAFPSLETLEISTMGNIKMIWDNQVYFQHLKTLIVSLCYELSHIFTLTIAGNLVELTKLRISNCIMLTKVIVDEGGEEGRVVAFKQLKYLELHALIGLRCFSSSKYALMFPLLEDVIVSGCPNMKFFSEGPIETPKLDRVRVTEHEVKFWKGNLNITIQNMFEGMANFAGAKKIRLSEFPELIGKWHSGLIPNKPSWQLKSLMVDQCPLFINAIPSRLMHILNPWSNLHVRDCKLLEEIFDLEGLVGVESTRELPSFVALDLVNLPKLRRLWNKDLQGSLPSNFLRNLTLYKCSNLRHAFAPLMTQCLANLWCMEIKECGQMEGVIADDEGPRSTVEKIIFPRLWDIKLECLPNLTSFLPGNIHALDCPELVSLTIAHCPKMRSLTSQSSMEIDNGTPSLFPPQVQFPRLSEIVLSHIDNLSKIWTDDPQETLAFENLRSLKVHNCKSLENIFPHWLATNLNELRTLQVESCGIEEVVASGYETPHATTSQVLFPELSSLVLYDIPRLKSFCPTLSTLNWSSLEELRVTHCDKLNMSFVAPMNKWTQRDDEQDLSNQEAHLSFEMDFPNLEKLLLVKKDIEMIRDGKLPDDIFGKLEALTLACFHDENAIFPSRFFLERFQKLQSLEVFCSSFEAIFPDEGLVDEETQPVLENLRELKLSKLYNLKHVWREEDKLVAKILQSIKTFEVWDCPGLTTIFPAVMSFQNLTELVVKNSSGLVYLATILAVINLVYLTDLTIIGCEKMKEVVANDETGEVEVISLGKLKSLTLQDMPSLMCFSSATSCGLRFPSLEYIVVEECPKMKIFSKGMLRTPQLCDATLFGYDWDVDLEGDLNTAIQKLSA